MVTPQLLRDPGARSVITCFVAPDEFLDIAAATGAMLIGRRIYEVGKRGIEHGELGKISGEDYGGGWSGPQFVLTHKPPDPPDPAARARQRDPGIRPAGTARRRHPQ